MHFPDPDSVKPLVQVAERRKYPRYRPHQLIYIEIGQDNGGFILDIGEGGLSFQGVVPLTEGDIVKVQFRLPETNLSICAEGQLIRAGISEKGGALKFLNIPAEAEMRLRDWVALAAHAKSAPTREAEAVPETADSGCDRAARLSSIFDQVSVPDPKNPNETAPIVRDETARLNSTLAQALKRSGYKVELPSLPPSPRHDPFTRKRRSNCPGPAAEAKNGPAPITSTPPLDASAEAAQLADRNLTKPSPTSKPARQSMKSALEAVLSGTAGAQRTAKASRVPNYFVRGVALACVVFATVAAGLVGSGRLRLVIGANAGPEVSKSAAGTTDVGSQIPLINSAGPSEPTTVQSQVETPAIPTSDAVPTPPVMATPAATSPVRIERSDKPAAVPQKDLSALYSSPAAEAARPAESVRKPQPLSPIQLVLSRPIEQAQNTTGRADAPVPSFPTGITQSVPDLGSHDPAPIMQTSGGSGWPATLASSQVEEKPADTQRTGPVLQRSTPVLAARDPNGTKPSSLEPPKLMLYVKPAYPASARAFRIQGTVEVMATIGKDGVPRALRVTNGNPQLAAAAIAAISKWRYRPALLAGQFEESVITITVQFSPA